VKRKTAEQRRIDDEMQQAVAAYRGPVTKCPSSKARGRPITDPDADPDAAAAADRWLRSHRNDQPVKASEQSAEHRRMRMQQQRQRQQWDDKGNAAEIRRRNRQERIERLRSENSGGAK
jgi:hypothetical protein